MQLSKKQKKRLYDIEYNIKNKERIKNRNAEYFQRTYDPVQAAIERKKNMYKHVEYCRQPEYKKLKKKYDEIHRAKEVAGEFWESQILIVKIIDFIRDDYKKRYFGDRWRYERRKARGYYERKLKSVGLNI